MVNFIEAAVELPAGANTQLAADIGVKNVVMLIVYLALILAGAYFVTKYVARRALTQGMKKRPGGSVFRARTNEPGTLLSVADRIAIDKTKTILVVEFQGKYYLMSTTEHDVKCIDKTPIPKKEQTEQETYDGAAETASYVYTREDNARGNFLSYVRDVFTPVKKNAADFETRLKGEVLKQNDGDGDK